MARKYKNSMEPEIIIVEPDITPEENARRWKEVERALQPIVDEYCREHGYSGIHFEAGI